MDATWVILGAAALLLLACLRSAYVRERALREALQRLAQSEDRFRMLFEHSGVGMALFTPERRFVQVNPALVRLLGYDNGELSGKPLADLRHPEDVSLGLSRSEQGLDTPPDLYEREKRYVHKNGRTVWARVLWVPVRDAAGQMLHLVGVLMDITERRRAENALAASELRYRLHFQGAFDGLHVCAESGEFLDANPAFCQMLGYSREQLLGLTFADVADNLPQLRRHFAAVVAQGGDRLETCLRRLDGSRVDVEISSATFETEGRRVLHGISRDVSARKRAGEALRHSEEKLREERDFNTQILETAEALIIVLDPVGRIIRFNGKCRAISGYTEEEVRGRVFWEFLIPSRLVAPIRGAFADLVETQVPTAFEEPWLTRTGEERTIAWHNTVVKGGRGEPRYVIGTGIDLTQQRRLEDQLRHSQKMETLGTLVGGIAHDFNNQMAVILGNLDMVLKEMPQNHANWRALTEVRHAGECCVNMTRNLLTFSRRKVFQARPFDLHEPIAAVLQLLQRLLPGSIHIERRLAPGPCRINGDSTQMQQVLMNLAVNARDAMPQGGVLTLASAVEVLDADACMAHVDARPGRFVVLTVSDTGVGMSGEVRSRLFEPFFTTKEIGRGTGLGLAMVFGIVKAHQGWITVDSAPRQGSTFRIYLPALDAAVVPATPSPAAVVRGGTESILVVDDEEGVRNLTRGVLTGLGFRVLLAADGEEALAVYRKQASDIHLVLLDFNMPGLTGMQVFRALQALNPAVRVVFYSGYSHHDGDELLAAGVLGFVAKPFDVETLAGTIRHALDAEIPDPEGAGQQQTNGVGGRWGGNRASVP